MPDDAATPAVAIIVEPIASKPSKPRDREEEEERQRRRDSSRDAAAPKSGWSTFAVVAIVLGVGGCCILTVGMVLVALLVPGVQKVRESAARTQSTNNLKQITLAFQGFHDANRRLPYNGTKNAVPKDATSGSWAFQILPYIDQTPLFNNGGRNFGIAAYMCPGRGRPTFEKSNGGGAWSDYFINNLLNDKVQGDTPNAPDRRLRMNEITDGTAHTIFAGHGSIMVSQYSSSANVTLSTNIFLGGGNGTMRAGKRSNQPGVAPTGVSLRRDAEFAPQTGSWGGPFPEGGLMGMGDGTVRIIPYSMNGNSFSVFLTPDGGEVAVLPDF